MSGEHAAARILADYLDALMRKDASAVDRFFHPEIEYVVNGVPSADLNSGAPPISSDCVGALPWLGLHSGHAGVRAFLEHMHANLDVAAFGPREIIADRDKAAAFGWFRLRARPTGRTSEIAYAIRCELKDGLIARYHFLENTFDVAIAFRAGGVWLVETDRARRAVPAP